MKAKTLNLEKSGLSPLSQSELQYTNGGGLLDSTVSNVGNGISSVSNSLLGGVLNSVYTLSVPSLVINTGNTLTGTLGYVNNTGAML